MAEFKSSAGQTIYDICLQTYGDLFFLLKLIQDNNVDSVNTAFFRGKVFIFDESLVNNAALSNRNRNDSIKYITQPAGGETPTEIPGDYNNDYNNDYL